MSKSSNSTNIKHVAIIMDGNGRWANARSHKRVWGHIRGSRVVSNIVEEAVKQEIQALTLYAFSTENWSRPAAEVKVLFTLLKKFLKAEKKKILDNNLQFRIIGDSSKLPKETKQLISDLEELSKNNNGMRLTFAFGYGGRSEIVQAANKFIKENPGKELTEVDLNQSLFLPELGDVDLMIRTGGDQRISNFLLWQVAYGELFFTSKQWPDFTKNDFLKILQDVSHRERRFGMVQSCESLDASKEVAENNKAKLSNLK